ncbi:cholesterol 7-desaturase-like [Ostrinia furnacalis]|uniref:cholesterol 7-desaturase-like n=1 Tax=Ostrinia furnacalis TaxID=93504 RepID=UPI00103B38DC|nr:cholesterol 7-desaturase-like [Ostrinia furnacalis]
MPFHLAFKIRKDTSSNVIDMSKSNECLSICTSRNISTKYRKALYFLMNGNQPSLLAFDARAPSNHSIAAALATTPSKVEWLLQEIPENGADVAHLNAVHSPSVVTGLAEKYPFLLNIIGSHVWSATWNKGEGHIADLTLTHDYKIMKCNLFHIDVTVQQIGPGFVRLFLKTPLGPLLVSQSVTPLGPLLQKVIHRVFSPAYNAPWAALVVYNEAYMFERDVAIWNNKIFVGAPAYVKADKTIRAFRSWFSQFYSENSKSFKDAIQNPLEW